MDNNPILNMEPNLSHNKTDLNPPIQIPKKKFSLWKVIKVLLIIGVIVVIGLPVIGYFAISHTEKEIKKQLFFGGDEKAQEEYNRVDRIYNKANQGDYGECSTLTDIEERQFCLNLALNASNDLKICELMDKDVYPPENSRSQESCYIQVNLVKNDRTICDRVSDKTSCLNLFARVDAQRKICGPLFEKSLIGPSPSDCYDYAVAQKTKAACDGLIPAGGQNWKEICDIKAGLVSTAALSVAPKNVNDCVMTKVAKIGSEVEGSLDSGSAIEYLNKVKQLSDQKIPQIDTAKVGDIVRVCLDALPTCERWKYRGNVYSANNITGGFMWTLSDSIEKCEANP